MLTQGYSEKNQSGHLQESNLRCTTFRLLVWMLYLPLSYRKLVEARPLNYNHGQIVKNNSALYSLYSLYSFIFIYISTHLSHIMDSFATPFPPFNVTWGKWTENSVQDWEWTSLCPALIGWGGGKAPQWSPKNVHWNECPKGRICPWS